jgi:hypothetical protein
MERTGASDDGPGTRLASRFVSSELTPGVFHG